MDIENSHRRQNKANGQTQSQQKAKHRDDKPGQQGRTFKRTPECVEPNQRADDSSSDDTCLQPLAPIMLKQAPDGKERHQHHADGQRQDKPAHGNFHDGGQFVAARLHHSNRNPCNIQ